MELVLDDRLLLLEAQDEDLLVSQLRLEALDRLALGQQLLVQQSVLCLALLQELSGSSRCLAACMVLVHQLHFLILFLQSINLNFVIRICLLGIFKVLDQHLTDVHQTPRVCFDVLHVGRYAFA